MQLRQCLLCVSNNILCLFVALEQCVESDAFGVSKYPGDRGYIPDEQITATSSNNKRDGSEGRLFHNSGKQSQLFFCFSF